MKSVLATLLSKFQGPGASSWLKEVPYWWAADDVICTVDGWLVCGFELQGLDAHSLSTNQLDAVSAHFLRWISSLEEGVAFNIVAEICNSYASDGVFSAYLNELKDKGEIASWLARDKIKFLTHQNDLFGSKLYLFLECPMHDGTQRFQRRDGIGGHHDLEQACRRTEMKLNRMSRSVHEELGSVGIGADRLDAKQMTNLIYRLLNPNRSKQLPCPKVDDQTGPARLGTCSTLRALLNFSAVENDKDYLLLDGIYHRILSLKNLPEGTIASSVVPLIQGLKPTATADFRVVYGLNVLRQRDVLRNLKLKGNVRQVLATTSSRASNLESQVASEDLNSCLHYIFQTGQRIVGVSLHVIVKSSSKEEVDDLTNRVQGLFRKVNDMEGMVEYYSQLQMFSRTLPGNQHSNFRSTQLTTENAADLLPLYAPWRGCQKPVTLLKNHLNGIVKFDPFDEELQAYNSILCGSTGSGKSFTTIYLLVACLQRNYPVLIIDVGGSYRKLCSIFDGEYLEINHGINLNPFFPYAEMRDAANPQVETKIQFLVSVLERLVIEKGKHETGLLNLEKALLFESLQHLYEKGQGTRPSLADFVGTIESLVRATDDKDKKNAGERIAKQLKIWCDGPLGKWFNGEGGISLNRSFVVLDMKGVEGDLKEIILLILIGHAWARIMQQPGPKVVVLDEVWSLLENPGTAGFVAELYRTARKYHCGIMSISQSPEDFVRSKVGPAVVSNSIVRYILRLKDGWECLAQSLKMTEREIELVQRLCFKKGEFSELFLAFGDRRAVIRVEPSPLEYWICTNHPSDLRIEREFQSKYPHLSTFDVLRLLSRIYPKGSWHEKSVSAA